MYVDERILRESKSPVADKPYIRQGYDLGTQLGNGDAEAAKKGYDALILRIEDETGASRAQKNANVQQVHEGMAQADPTDVKSPGRGTDTGYFIYWNTENTVNEAIDKITAYCKQHNFCAGVGFDQSSPALAYGALDPLAAANIAPSGKKELGEFLRDMNDWLYKKIPDGLERHTFKADFNRRRHQFGIVADMDDSLSIVMKEQKGF